jgi:hypothetical protein
VGHPWRVGALLDGVRREHREREADDDQDNRDDRQNHRISNVFCDAWSIPVWVACGFDGELIEVQASWESSTVASLKCSTCGQGLSTKS